MFRKGHPPGSPRDDSGWSLEISLDLDWVHAIAPAASILLVESASNSISNLLGAVDYAAAQPGVHQVSMSWGGSEFSSESSFDYHFQASGVSFFASSGDSGTGVEWPAISPFAIGVGGTTLNLNSTGSVTSETAWSGSGGGLSVYDSRPSYQDGFQSNSARGIPDVSFDANPSTGVPVYDTVPYQGQSGWFQVGGTSAGAPQWAALMAIVNSGRSTPISSTSSQADSFVYSAASGAPSGTPYTLNFRDILSGTNGACGTVCTAGPGYDFVTGLGSPLANHLVPALQAMIGGTTTTTSSTSTTSSTHTSSTTTTTTSSTTTKTTNTHRKH